jgi:hypothetical protein
VSKNSYGPVNIQGITGEQEVNNSYGPVVIKDIDGGIHVVINMLYDGLTFLAIARLSTNMANELNKVGGSRRGKCLWTCRSDQN